MHKKCKINIQDILGENPSPVSIQDTSFYCHKALLYFHSTFHSTLAHCCPQLVEKNSAGCHEDEKYSLFNISSSTQLVPRKIPCKYAWGQGKVTRGKVANLCFRLVITYFLFYFILVKMRHYNDTNKPCHVLPVRR